MPYLIFIFIRVISLMLTLFDRPCKIYKNTLLVPYFAFQ